MGCQKAIGVAKSIQEEFGGELDLRIYTNASLEAKHYDLKGPTTLVVNQAWIPLHIATSKEKMEEFLKNHPA